MRWRHRDGLATSAESRRHRQFGGDIAASAENREVTSVMSAKVENNVNLRHEPTRVAGSRGR